MRTLLFGGLLSLGLLSSSMGAVVSYSMSSTFLSGMGGVGGGSAFCPLFDTSRPEIPDGAILEGVGIQIYDRSGGYLEIYNNTASSLTFSGTASIFSAYTNLTGGPTTLVSSSTPFSFSGLSIPAGGVRSQSFFTENTWFFEDTDLDEYLPQSGNEVAYFSRNSSFGGSVSPAVNQNAVDGIYMIDELALVASTVTVNYTYRVPQPAPDAVPDGGSTALLLGLGLLILRRLKMTVPA